MSITPTPINASPPPFLSRHPIILTSLLGAIGAIAAVPVATLISALAAVWIGDTFLSSTLAPDYAEGLGYLIGFYCLAMFPCGATLVGLLTGAFTFVVRPIRDDHPNPLLPIAAGMVVSTLVTLAVALASVVLLRQ